MDDLVVVTYPAPIILEARRIEQRDLPEGSVALAYYYRGHLVARGIVAPEVLDALDRLLAGPVAVALAASEGDQGDIEARFCLVLPIDPEQLRREDEEPEDEPWKASVPPPPAEAVGTAADGTTEEPHIALLPLGNVVRNARERRHPEDVTADVRDMLDNLLAGQARDAVDKAIDDLLSSL